MESKIYLILLFPNKAGNTSYCSTLRDFWGYSMKYLKQISSDQQYVINKVLFVTASDLVGSYVFRCISLELIFKSLEACVLREKKHLRIQS